MATNKSLTPIFDETLTAHPEELWLAAPRVLPWPHHFAECKFDGYNWHVCTCPHVVRQLQAVGFPPSPDPESTQPIGLTLPAIEGPVTE